MNKNEKILKKYEKNKLNQKRTMEPFLCSKKIKINKKNLKISQNFANVVFQTWFCEIGFCIAYFSGPQKILKKNKKSQKISKKNKTSLKFAGKKQKKQEKKQIN